MVVELVVFLMLEEVVVEAVERGWILVELLLVEAVGLTGSSAQYSSLEKFVLASNSVAKRGLSGSIF